MAIEKFSACLCIMSNPVLAVRYLTIRGHTKSEISAVSRAGFRQHKGYPDLVVHFGDEKLIVELKVISGELRASEEQQLRNYLNILNLKRGLLINFQQSGKKQGKTRLDIREVTVS